MKLNRKRFYSIIAMYLVFALVYTALVILIPFKKIPASWVAYAASMLSMLIGFVACIVGFGKDYTITSKFYGYPIYRIGIIYTMAQTIVSIIFYLVGAFINVPVWVSLIISALLLGGALIGLIITDNIRDYVEQVEVRNVGATKNIKTIIENVSEIYDSCKEETIRSELNTLMVRMKHSDPISSAQTSAKESEIISAVEMLRGMISIKSDAEIIKQIDSISQLLSARNRICINSKS